MVSSLSSGVGVLLLPKPVRGVNMTLEAQAWQQLKEAQLLQWEHGDKNYLELLKQYLQLLWERI